MKASFGTAADALLHRTVESGVPGVVALVTDRHQTLYAGSAGVRCAGGSASMSSDTVLAIYSCTKAITATTLMQLIEDGTIGLDDPAREYVPEIAASRVLDGFDADDTPRLRPPATEITVKHLLLHTAGFGYDMFNPDLVRFNRSRNVSGADRMRTLMSVMTGDPGRRWEYGVNLDWAGKIVEAIRGEPLGGVMRRHVFAPLGIEHTAYTLSPAMRERRAALHERGHDGSLTAKPDVEPPADVAAQTGGSGLHGTADDYLAFMRMILNDGAAPGGERILEPATVALMATNALGPLAVRPLPGAMPQLTNPVELFPGIPKSWGYSWMINDEPAPTGRPAGTCGWAGLANLYYWIDRRNGIGGFWGTQILPFIDPASFTGFLEFETAVYTHLA